MEPGNLLTYVTRQLQAGVPSTEIKEQLKAVGWSDEEADRVYAESLIANGIPVPEAGAKGAYSKKATTVEVVLNFFSFILLGTVAFAIGNLYFAVINHFFPDALQTGSLYYYQSTSNTIHYAIAALVIGYPLYFASVRLWFKRFRQDETKAESKLTKWITYLVLLVVSVTIVGDLISIVYTFLQGEITARFFFKALTILVIAGMIFGFYYLERRKVQYRADIQRNTFKVFGYVLTTFIVLGIILGFAAAGSPATERDRSFDQQRSRDLQQIATCIDQFANQYQRLPADLAELQQTNLSYCANKQDPETNNRYEYRVLANLTKSGGLLTGQFELCADFSLDSIVATGYTNGSKWYQHTSGKNCDTELVSVRSGVSI